MTYPYSRELILSNSVSIRPLVRQVSIALAVGAGALMSASALAEEVTPVPAEKVEAVKQVETKSSADAGSEGASLASVTVTAQKREENIQEVATAISAFGGKELVDSGVGRSANEVLSYVPNASAGTQQHGRPRWWIRGVGAGLQNVDMASPVGFYLDEVFISNASATGYPLFDLDRVEVLRGPQGTLWGKNTTGGAVSVVSKKPSFNESKTDDYLKLDYGSYGDKIIQGGLGAVLVDERLAGRISFHNEDQDGFRRNLFKGTKDSGLTDSAIRGQLLAILTPDIEALLNVHYRKYETDGAITTVESYRPDRLYRGTYSARTGFRDVDTNADDWSDTTQNGANLNIKWQLGKLALTSITGYEDYDNQTAQDSDFTPLELTRAYTDVNSRQWSQEFRLASPKEDRWNWIAGFHYFNEDINSDAYSARLPDAGVPRFAVNGSPLAYTLTSYNHKAESKALFGSTTFNFTDQFNTTFGLRWSRETKELDFSRSAATAASWSNLSSWWNSFNGTIGGAGTFARNFSKTWNAVTYDLTPEYKITPTDRVYFKYAHGVKSGGYNTSAAALVALQEVKPEKLDSYEFGYKSEWLNGRLNFNATAFYYDYKDVQINVVGPNPAAIGASTSYLQNADQAHTKGLEFEVEALPTERLHLLANLGLINTEFDQLQVVNGGANLSGNELVRTPEVSATLAADYRIPVANGGKVVISGDARYQSEQHYFVTPQSSARYLLNQEPYTTVNARVAYSTAGEKYTLTAYANNLFDKEYNNHSLPAANAATGTTGDIVYRAAPRTIGVSFITRF